jgi:hypothetical protein
MPPNAVQYAEDVLEVHKVWQQAQERFDQYTSALGDRAKLQSDLRKIRASLSDREAILIQEGRIKYAELSATAFDKVYRTLVHDDSDHRELREHERERQCDLDLVEADISAHEYQLKLFTSRMNELGGLLEFYAAAKRK